MDNYITKAFASALLLSATRSAKSFKKAFEIPEESFK